MTELVVKKNKIVKKKVAKKKTSKKKVTKPVEPKTLTQTEAHALETEGLRHMLAKKEADIVKLRDEVAALKRKEELQEASALKRKSLEDVQNAKNRYQALVKKIQDRTGIEGAFGWDPETLEIIV